MLGRLIKNPTHRIIALILTLGALAVGIYYLLPENVTQAQHERCQQQYDQLTQAERPKSADEVEVIYSARTDSCLIGTTFTRPGTNEYYVKVFQLDPQQLTFMYKYQPFGFYLDDDQQKVKCDEAYYYLETITDGELDSDFGCEKSSLEAEMQRQMKRFGFSLVE